MLSKYEVVTNVAVKDLDESKKFYEKTLGLDKVEENDFGVTYKSGAGRLFVYVAPTAGSGKATCATWEVTGIGELVAKLEDAGVKFEHYDFPGAKHEGNVHIMGGSRAAWFKDPSGNILGLSEM